MFRKFLLFVIAVTASAAASAGPRVPTQQSTESLLPAVAYVLLQFENAVLSACDNAGSTECTSAQQAFVAVDAFIALVYKKRNPQTLGSTRADEICSALGPSKDEVKLLIQILEAGGTPLPGPLLTVLAFAHISEGHLILLEKACRPR